MSEGVLQLITVPLELSFEEPFTASFHFLSGVTGEQLPSTPDKKTFLTPAEPVVMLVEVPRAEPLI